MLKRVLGPLAVLVVLAACTNAPEPSGVTVKATPAPGATNVSVDAVVTATFNVDMRQTTIDGAFSLSSSTGPVTGTLTYDATARRATFTPDARLEYATEYTASVAGTVRSAAGGAIARGGSYSWKFTTEGVSQTVSSVTVSPASAAVLVGETQQFEATVTATGGAAEAVTWSSSNEEVATVDADGLVTALTVGTATISATSDFNPEIAGSANLQVGAVQVVTSVVITPATSSVAPGAQVQLTASVEPVDSAPQAVTWTSSDETVATVDEDGLVTAVAGGTATISAASDADSSVVGTAELNVQTVALTVTPVTADLSVGGTIQLGAGAVTTGGASGAVTWTSGDDAVATVDEDGLVTAVADGTATITATSDFNPAVSSSAVVTVYDALTVNHYIPVNVEAEVGELNEPLGVIGGLAPYTYTFTIEAPEGWPEDYPEVPYDDLASVGVLRLPPVGVAVDQSTGSLVGTGDQAAGGYYAFFVEVEDALGQTDYAFVELDVVLALRFESATYVYSIGCGADSAPGCADDAGTFQLGSGVDLTTYSRFMPPTDVHVYGARGLVTFTWALTTGDASDNWGFNTADGTIGRQNANPENNASDVNNGTRSYTVTAHDDGSNETAVYVVEFVPAPQVP